MEIFVAKNTSLAPKNGHRIEIHALRHDLSKDECREIINNRLTEAGAEGQVVVMKPSEKFGGKLLPFGVNNCNEKGTFFNDVLF